MNRKCAKRSLLLIVLVASASLLSFSREVHSITESATQFESPRPQPHPTLQAPPDDDFADIVTLPPETKRRVVRTIEPTQIETHVTPVPSRGLPPPETPTSTPTPTTPVLPQKHYVLYSWDGKEQSEDVDVIDHLRNISMSPTDPCTKFIDCVHEIALLFSTLEWGHGYLIVASGEGTSAVVRYKYRGPRHSRSTPIIDHKQHPESVAARTLTISKQLERPTVFHVPVHDIDINGFRQRSPTRWIGRMEPLWRFSFLFYLHCSPTVDSYGRVAQNVVPVPHFIHLQREQDYPKDLAFVESMLPQHRFNISYESRPKKVVWRGSTTGHKYVDLPPGRLYSTKPYLKFTDRGRAVSIFRGKRIGDVWFTGVAEPANNPGRDWIKRSVGSTGPSDWYKLGRVFLDVDGNSNSWEGLRWKLLAGGPVLKINSTENHIQWYYHLLQDGTHLRLVDLNIDDILQEAEVLINSTNLANKLIYNAMKISVENISATAARNFLTQQIRNCWANKQRDSTKDWRIDTTNTKR